MRPRDDDSTEEKIKKSKSLTDLFHSLRAGDVVYIDIDTLFLPDLDKNAGFPKVAEKHLPKVLQQLSASNITVYGVTSRSLELKTRTVEQLQSSGITLSDVIQSSPENQAATLTEHFTTLSATTKPRRIILINKSEEQLNQIADIPNVDMKCYHYEHPEIQLIIHRDNHTAFPETLQGFEVDSALGGGTGSVYLLKGPNAEKLVLKHGAHSDAMKIEILSNAIYHVLGVPVPDLAVYNTLPEQMTKKIKLPSVYGMFQLAQFVENEKEQNTTKKEVAKEYFLAFALLGNIDIAKDDNFFKDKDGKTYLIDAGATFMFRSLGGERNDKPEELTELIYLRNKNVNLEGHQWFSGLTEQQLKEQARSILAKTTELEAVIWDVSAKLDMPPTLRDKFIDCFVARLNKLANLYEIDVKAKMTTPVMRQNKMVADIISSSDIMRELKRTLKDRNNQERASEEPQQLTPSELHLKAVLGEDWQRENAMQNIDTMVKKHFGHLTKDLAPEQVAQFEQSCVRLLEKEKQTSSEQFHFYHACDDQVAFAYEIYSELYNLLQARDDWPVFRAKYGIFNQFKSITDFIKHYSQEGPLDNDAKGFNEYAISTNVFLFGNHRNTGSCSIDYFFENKVSRDITLESMLTDLFRPFNIKEEKIKELVSLYERYAQKQGGALYQIGMAREDAKAQAYPAHVRGVVYSYGYSLVLPDILDALSKKAELSSEDKLYINALQARLLVSPAKHLSVECVRSSPLDQQSLTEYKSARKKTVRALAHDILLNLKPSNREYFLPNLPLLGVADARKKSFQLSENDLSLATPEDLAKAILDNNAVLVKSLLSHYPSWKNIKISMPTSNTPFKVLSAQKAQRKTGVSENKMFPIEMMLFHSKLPSVLFEIFGEDFFKKLPFEVDGNNFMEILRRIPSTNRLEFAQQYDKFTNSLEFEIIGLLPANQRYAYAESKKDEISHDEILGYQLAYVLRALQEEEKFAFLKLSKSKINNVSRFNAVAESFPIESRLTILEYLIKEKQLDINAISQSKYYGLPELLDLFSVEDRLSFIVKQTDFKVFLSFLDVLSSAEEKLRCALEMDKFTESDNLQSIARLLPMNKRLSFIERHRDNIKETDAILKLLSPDDRKAFVATLTASPRNMTPPR